MLTCAHRGTRLLDGPAEDEVRWSGGWGLGHTPSAKPVHAVHPAALRAHTCAQPGTGRNPAHLLRAVSIAGEGHQEKPQPREQSAVTGLLGAPPCSWGYVGISKAFLTVEVHKEPHCCPGPGTPDAAESGGLVGPGRTGRCHRTRLKSENFRNIKM